MSCERDEDGNEDGTERTYRKRGFHISSTWTLHGPWKMGSVPKIKRGHDPISKGAWRLHRYRPLVGRFSVRQRM